MFIPTYVQRNPVALLCILFYNLYSIISYPMFGILLTWNFIILDKYSMNIL